MMKRSDYLAAGGLVEYYSTHYQDVDLCLRLLAMGKTNLYVPHAVLMHYEGSTRGKFYDHIDRALLLDTWGDLIAKGDPFYNPNFSLARQNSYDAAT
jgi:GT2 family glycosyltransferase